MNRKEKNPAGGVLFFWNGVGTGKDIAMNEKNAKNQNQELNQKDLEQKDNEEIKDMGQITLDSSRQKHKIHLLSIIGEIEGHECLSNNTKSTKYEHVLPKLASIEDDNEVDGVLVLIDRKSVV